MSESKSKVLNSPGGLSLLNSFVGEQKRKRGTPKLERRKGAKRDRPAKRAKRALCPHCDHGDCSGRAGRGFSDWFVCQVDDCKSPCFASWVELDQHLDQNHEPLAVCAKCHKPGSLTASSCATLGCGELKLGSWRHNVKPATAGELKGPGGAAAPGLDDDGLQAYEVEGEDDPANSREFDLLCSCLNPTRAAPCRRCHPGGFLCGVDGCPVEKDTDKDLQRHLIDRHDFKPCAWCDPKKAVSVRDHVLCARCAESAWTCPDPDCKKLNPKDALGCMMPCGFQGWCAVPSEDGEARCKEQPLTPRHPFCAAHDYEYWWCPVCKVYVSRDWRVCTGPHCDGVRLCPESSRVGVKCKKTVHHTQKALFNHLRYDHEFEFTCPACDEPFPDKKSLRQHADSTTSEWDDDHEQMKFCDACDDEVYADVADCWNRNYFCASCVEDASCRVEGCKALIGVEDFVARDKHMEKDHGQLLCYVCCLEYVEPSPGKAFAIPVCAECNKLPINSKDRKLECTETCIDAVFKSAQELRSHLATVHPDDWRECKKCDALVRTNSTSHEHYPAKLHIDDERKTFYPAPKDCDRCLGGGHEKDADCPLFASRCKMAAVDKRVLDKMFVEYCAENLRAKDSSDFHRSRIYVDVFMSLPEFKSGDMKRFTATATIPPTGPAGRAYSFVVYNWAIFAANAKPGDWECKRCGLLHEAAYVCKACAVDCKTQQDDGVNCTGSNNCKCIPVAGPDNTSGESTLAGGFFVQACKQAGCRFETENDAHAARHRRFVHGQPAAGAGVGAGSKP